MIWLSERCAVQMWYSWACVWNTDARQDTTHLQTVLEQASAALADCVMLAFALADVQESCKGVANALKVYEVWACHMTQHVSRRQAPSSATVGMPVVPRR